MTRLHEGGRMCQAREHPSYHMIIIARETFVVVEIVGLLQLPKKKKIALYS